MWKEYLEMPNWSLTAYYSQLFTIHPEFPIFPLFSSYHCSLRSSTPLSSCPNSYFSIASQVMDSLPLCTNTHTQRVFWPFSFSISPSFHCSQLMPLKQEQQECTTLCRETGLLDVWHSLLASHSVQPSIQVSKSCVNQILFLEP